MTVWACLALADLIKFPIPANRVPFGLNSTSAYGLIVPGLPAKYPNAPVSLQLGLLSVPTLTITPSGISTQWPFDFAFFVQPSGAPSAVEAFDIIASANITLTLSLATQTGDLVIDGDLTYLGAQLTTGNSTVGPVTGLGLLNDLVSFALTDVVLPAINKALVPGIPLPSFPGLAFTKAALETQQGFALIGLDFTFNPASGEEAPRAPPAIAVQW